MSVRAACMTEVDHPGFEKRQFGSSKAKHPETEQMLVNVNSRSRSLYAVARPFVCCLSATLVHPTPRQRGPPSESAMMY